MPELPEVETVRTGLEPALVGAVIERALVHDARLVRPFDPGIVAAELEGERVAAVSRRGKYLLIALESGRTLVVHLRMTGSFRHGAAGSLPDDPHRRAVLTLSNGLELAYRDVRRFGTWELLEPGELDAYLAARLGPEPLGALTAAALRARLAGRRAPLKAALLDQRTLAGLGNIYVDEALWRARLSPLRPAGALDAEELARLHRAIRTALRLGIARQGASLRDYATPGGANGSMQHEFRVYGRGGEPCERCSTAIAKTRVGGRGTWFCPRCQPAPDAL